MNDFLKVSHFNSRETACTSSKYNKSWDELKEIGIDPREFSSRPTWKTYRCFTDAVDNKFFYTKNFRYCLLHDLTFSTNQIRFELEAFQNTIILSLFSAFHIDSYWRRETAQYLWSAFIEYFVVLKFYFTSKIMWIDIFKANNCTWRRNSRKPDNMLSILHIIVKTHSNNFCLRLFKIAEGLFCFASIY